MNEYSIVMNITNYADIHFNTTHIVLIRSYFRFYELCIFYLHSILYYNVL